MLVGYAWIRKGRLTSIIKSHGHDAIAILKGQCSFGRYAERLGIAVNDFNNSRGSEEKEEVRIATKTRFILNSCWSLLCNR